jgi:glycosyltransferase involved in cell wall biosynthesis
VARRAERIVTISQGLKDFYIEKKILPSKIIVARDGIDLERCKTLRSKEEARVHLGLPLDTKIAMYIGRLDGWKGVDTLLAASMLLPHGVVLVVVGGEPTQVSKLSRQYPNVRFLGFRPYRELADTMVAADVLVLPNTGKDEISVKFTSPLKLFAYMTSGVPMVASDLPSIREVLDEHSAFLVTPDDAPALAFGIQQALESGSERAAYALARVADYSWKHRAERIVAAL